MIKYFKSQWRYFRKCTRSEQSISILILEEAFLTEEDIMQVGGYRTAMGSPLRIEGGRIAIGICYAIHTGDLQTAIDMIWQYWNSLVSSGCIKQNEKLQILLLYYVKNDIQMKGKEKYETMGIDKKIYCFIICSFCIQFCLFWDYRSRYF